MVGNKILPVFAFILNLLIAGLIFRTWTSAKDAMVNLIGTTGTPLMIVSIILFSLFFFLGIPILIFYSDTEFTETLIKMLNGMITGFFFIIAVTILPLFLAVFLGLIDAVTPIAPTHPAIMIFIWLFTIALTIGLPIFVFFMNPIEKVREHYEY
jgi:hypothetical protein